MKDVHTEHCCLAHGCKYGDKDCTVTTGKAPQSYDCEECGYDSEDPSLNRIKELEEVLKGFLNEAHTASKPLHKHSEWSIKAQKVLENKQC